MFRVDMRLRPYGDSGALVSNFDALEAYFVAQGREWERYAWIKARAVSGSASSVEALEAIVRPFVYRKYLDYGTLEAMRRLHAEVRRDVARRELAEHVKLGPGGIREIEFIAQALQLVRGGRDPELTARPTLAGAGRCSSGKRLLAGDAAARACRGLRVPAQRRAPPAVPGRRADARAARRRGRPRAPRADGGFRRPGTRSTAR